MKRNMPINITQIMRNGLATLIIVATCLSTVAQRDLTPGGRRGDTFGTRDFRNLNNYGLQVSFGPTYMMTRQTNPSVKMENGTMPYQYTHDPIGEIGIFAEIGMSHYPMKPSIFKFLKHRLVSYYDWGLGFKYFGGSEATTIDYTDAQGAIDSTTSGSGQFYNGYGFGRFTLHKMFSLGKRHFIDNGLGLNIDYRVIDGNRNYKDAVMASTQTFHNSLVAQVHYELGIGFKLKRGSYLILGAQTPILGIQDWNGGNPGLKWYSSNYWPILFKVKYIQLFEKKSKGCNNGSDEDRKRNKEYMQGQ
jgi:hypothetical protein